MSYSCDETYTVYDERFPRARKEHKCDACKETIRGGARYAKIGIVFDGSAETIKRCLRCQKIHEHLRKLCHEVRNEDMWPDERLNCGMDYEEEWGALPDEIAALAFVDPNDPILLEENP